MGWGGGSTSIGSDNYVFLVSELVADTLHSPEEATQVSTSCDSPLHLVCGSGWQLLISKLPQEKFCHV